MFYWQRLNVHKDKLLVTQSRWQLFQLQWPIQYAVTRSWSYHIIAWTVLVVAILSLVRLSLTRMDQSTRKLSYRKHDRAMRRIYECPKNFRESLTMPTATFPETFNVLFFRLMLWICVQNLKFVALSVSEIIVGTQKIGQSQDMPTLPFHQNFNELLFG